MDRAEVWRAKSRQAALEDAADLELPSGMVVRARRPGPGVVAGFGRLPLGLTTAAAGRDGGAREASNEEMLQLADFMRNLLLYCVVDPVISIEQTGPGIIHPRDIADDDLNYIYAWAMRGQEAVSLESFRHRRRLRSAGVDGARVPHATVDPAGDRRPHAGTQSGSRRRRRAGKA